MSSAKSRTALNAESETGDTISSGWAGDVYLSSPNIVDDGATKTFKLELNYEDFQPEAGVQSIISCGSLPAGYLPLSYSVVYGDDFAGGANTSATVSIYDEDELLLIAAYSCPIPNSAGLKYDSDSISLSGAAVDWLAGVPLVAQLDVSASVDTLTAGSISVYITCQILPSNATVIFP